MEGSYGIKVTVAALAPAEGDVDVKTGCLGLVPFPHIQKLQD